MARKEKQSLEYFPFDVDFFDDDKIYFVAERFGEKGEMITVRLLCRIYKQGYYTEWNDDVAELFSKRAGKNITPSLANDVVEELVKRDFFNKDIFNRFGVLTSSGIQSRWIYASIQAKRKSATVLPELDCKITSGGIPEKLRKVPEKGREGIEGSKGKEENRIKFRLREKNIFDSFSDFFNQNHETFLEGWQMTNRDLKPPEVFKRMETDYTGYLFNNENHLLNAFKSTAQKILNEKSNGSKSKPTSNDLRAARDRALADLEQEFIDPDNG
jgi:hypothetical protein